MSRDLPPHPNFDHLKKQAKALLRTLREQNTAATLADAQHTLAREYGFASWAKLKAHLEQPPLFPRFTETARRALFFSRYEAASAGRLRIEPEHTLLGVIRAAGGVTRELLEGAGITLDAARSAVVESEGREPIVEPVEIPFQPATRALFSTAADEADRLGHTNIATTHIVLALLRGRNLAASFLRARGVTPEIARAAASRGQD